MLNTVGHYGLKTCIWEQ